MKGKLIRDESDAEGTFKEFWSLFSTGKTAFTKLWKTGWFIHHEGDIDRVLFSTEKKREVVLAEPEVQKTMKQIEFLDILGKDPYAFIYLWRSSFFQEWKDKITEWMK